MLSALICFLVKSPIRMAYHGGDGISLLSGGVPIIQSSGFQYYAPGWKKGYFSSNYNSVEVSSSTPNQILVKFAGYHKEAWGQLSYKLVGNTLHVTEDFFWGGKSPAEIELTGAQFWAPAFLHGTFCQGAPNDATSQQMATFGSAPKASVPLGNRILSNFPISSNAVTPVTINALWGMLEVQPVTLNPGSNWVLFDGRNYPQDWAKDKSLFWFGQLGIPISKGHPVHAAFNLKIDYGSTPNGKPLPIAGINSKETMLPEKITNVENPVNQRLPFVPFPKELALKGGPGLKITGKWKFPAGQFFHWSEFTDTLKRRFILPSVASNAPAISVDGGSADISTPHQGYQITVRPGHITVLGRDEMGLRFGLYRLANMVYSKNGNLYVPYGQVTDWPSDNWRGFHLFSGPKALSFQTKLFDRVLGPLFYNHAVIECERTEWESTPNQRGPQYMTKPQLKSLFEMYQKRGINPIPLIESFGHMSWAFANGANLDIAVNPKKTYGVDPRKPGTKAFLDSLWNEAIQLLKPKVVHFGCDEVSMRGYPKGSRLLNQLWPLQMKILGNIAKKDNVGMMIWGDDCLAPGEAPDATNAPNRDQAAERRASIPSNTIIADWHYKSDSNLADFETSLNTWTRAGLRPIAATWYDPKNIQGFVSAAVQEQVGTLQTTWQSDYSDKQNPLNAFDQFAAFILNSEYAWSGRQDPETQFGYDYRRLFWQLYYERPIPLSPIGGITLRDAGKEEDIYQDGRFSYAKIDPIKFYSAINKSRDGQTKQMEIPVDTQGRWLIMNADTLNSANVGAKIGTVDVQYSDGSQKIFTLIYGWNIRSEADGRIAPLSEKGSHYNLYFQLDPKRHIQNITIHESNMVAGITIYGLSIEK